MPHGKGKQTLTDGSTYEGMFCEGNKSGKGIFKWHDGSVFDGTWKNNLFNGIG